MHRSPENARALFQVASQFKLLEMVGPADAGAWLTRYKDDPTQGPACAVGPVIDLKRRHKEQNYIFLEGRTEKIGGRVCWGSMPSSKSLSELTFALN